MICRRTWGPAPRAGPLLLFGARALSCARAAVGVGLALVLSAVASVRPAQAIDWIPPTRVTALLPGATLAPGTTQAISLILRANDAGANLAWVASSSGSFTALVNPPGGSIFVPANSVATVTLSVTMPALATGASSLAVNLTDAASGAQVAKVNSSLQAATGGRPEVLPVPSVWASAAGLTGSVSFQVHSLTGTSESVSLTTGRFNPDSNNEGGLFAGTNPSGEVSLPGGATITVDVPTTIPARAWGGNVNAVQLSVTSTGGISNAAGYALASAPLPDSLPTALVPRGLDPLDAPAAGRDGPASLASRGYWLAPCGAGGVRVIRHSATDSIGPIDGNADGRDDRIVGTIRIPSYAAALSIIPGFVTAAGETLDVGLLAVGDAGLMLLDLRVVEDPLFIPWEDVFDTDMNGIDDRILRTIPTPGFATDTDWLRAPSGRCVALVADADAGSNPVAAGYDPALVVPGTGAGVIAVDVAAALDSLGPIPYAAGAVATPGSALDVELRGGLSLEMAVADGAAGVALYGLTVSSAIPAAVTFSYRGSAALSSAWGSAYARDLAWVSNTGDSSYVAVAAAAGGVQVVRAPRGAGAPALVLAQQMSAPAVGIAGAWTGTLGVAMQGGGIALLRAPGAAELNQIGPAAPPPYTAPVLLSRGQPWGFGGALEKAVHQSWTTSATALRFRDTVGPIPDLLVSDGTRLLVLRPGAASVTGVESAPESAPKRAALRAAPNPSAGQLWLEMPLSISERGTNMVIAVFDARGRLIRKLHAVGDGRVARAQWDGRDEGGRDVASGRYWVRPLGRDDTSRPATPITLLR